MIIANSTRTVDSTGRVWIKTDVKPGSPDMSASYAAREQSPAIALVPDSELAGLAASLKDEPTGLDWTAMQPEHFDTDAKPVQCALFAEPDRCGTPDLFDSIGSEEAPRFGADEYLTW